MAMNVARRSFTTAYEKSKHQILVIGGGGYVGSNVLQYGVHKGIRMRSLNRSGKPNWNDIDWINRVDWHKGDVFNPEVLKEALEGTTAVVSTVGAFGSNEFMQQVCGDATIAAVEAAKESGVERFVFVSNSGVGNYRMPSWAPMYGYYNGKDRAEQSVFKNFPETGVAVRPGFIYGWRRLNTMSIPLHFIGTPMSLLARGNNPVSTVVSKLPFVGEELHSAVPVEVVAKSAILSAMGSPASNILDSTAMMELAASHHETK